VSNVVTPLGSALSIEENGHVSHSPQLCRQPLYSPVDVSRWLPLPDHNQLPDSDGAIVENHFEFPQGVLLTTTIRPHLDLLHPDGQYITFADSGIYWNLTNPPLKGCKSPDWCYIPNIAPTRDGEFRRSYVMWNELERPLIAIEFVSGNGSEERDRTPKIGKFWVYQTALAIPYYFIWDVWRNVLEGYQRLELQYVQLTPNERGRYPIPAMKVELGVWQGLYHGVEAPWLRWNHPDGTALSTSEERADRLAAKLRELGLNPDEV